MRPAQFGNWAQRTQLNADYDQAHPDVVVLTFGADDVDFSGIVSFCVSGFSTAESSSAEAIAAADDVSGAIDDAFAKFLATPGNDGTHGDPGARHDASNAYCTAENPGAPIEKLFWQPVNSGEIARHYREMVTSIRERATDPLFGDGGTPEIVFTTYHRPLPADLNGTCWDVWPLSDAEQSYLRSLQEKLQSVLVKAVGDMDGVHIADISEVMDGHRWCDEDPWVYGLSVYWTDLAFQSLAPFHPTVEGQKAIAAAVEPVVRAALG